MKKYLLNFRIIVVIICTLLTITQFKLQAQTPIFSSTISSELEVDNSGNSIDENLATFASVRASSGIALGIGSYSGHLELQYPSLLSPNTTSYIKVSSDDDLLPFLLGGNLGNLLANIGGSVLLGNQEFTVEAKNVNTNVLQGNSNNPTDFATNLLKVVVDANNDYFIAVSPDVAYDRIRFTNRIGSLLGLNNTRSLNVYDSFYTSGTSSCGLPSYTSFSGSGLSLDLLNIGGAGVSDPGFAIDNNSNTFSQLSLGIIAVAGEIEQTFYFDAASNITDNSYISLAINPSLLQVGIADNIQIEGFNGSEELFSGTLSSLLNIDLLGLLQSGNSTTIGFSPNASIDRITIRLTSLLNVSLVQELRVFEVYRAPAIAIIDPQSENIAICDGSTADLIAETQDPSSELRWYDAELGGNLLATLNSGDTFTTPLLNIDTTYYVATANPSCPEESPRIAVPVNVVAIPTQNDITVLGNELPICSSSDVVLIPTSTIDGTFTWYFDTNRTTQITDGLVIGSATYTINSETGTLTINGLDDTNSPYTFYVNLTEESAGCQNNLGDLKPVDVIITDSNNVIDITLDSTLSLENVIDIVSGNSSTDVNGTVTGNANPGDIVTIIANGNTYNGTLDSNLNFSIALDGNDILYDLDNILDIFIGGSICTQLDEVLIDLPEIIIDDILQVFCASDNPTIADLNVSSDIVFFDSLLGDTLLDVNTPLVDGQVYFAGISNIAASILARVQITVDLTDILPPTTISINQTFCESDLATIADIQVNEIGVLFYANASGGLVLDPSTLLSDGIYFAANVENGCESLIRLMINVDVINILPPTTVSMNQTFCESDMATIADIQVNETGVLFYDSASGGNTLDPSVVLTDGTYFAANVENGCESLIRLAINVDIIEEGSATLVGELEEYCLNGSYTFTTESNMMNYNWVVTGGIITEGGTATDNFAKILWNSTENNTINTSYENIAGCSSSITQNISVISCEEVLGEEFELIVYNEFTPNNDGFNDFFTIGGILNYSSTVKVYNRNGNTVFEANNYQNNWDGIANVSGVLKSGEKLPSGTYYYVINIPQLQRNLTGWIQLAR
tara:strand:+ start:471 stop:3716 length:3246 start_codon:yes stop_codon:yes gene_type:complete